MNTVYMFCRQKTGDYLAGCAGLKKVAYEETTTHVTKGKAL
jgi:hypothetical protein